MRESKGNTHVKAHCKVCGQLSPTVIYTKNGVLASIHIQCYEHADYLLNKIKFEVTRKGLYGLKVEHHGY